jgi:uncharacterized protein (TIGR02145 family)
MKLKFTESKHLLLAVALIFCATIGFAQGTITKAFTANGSWTVPPGVTEVTIECWGAGGAGKYMPISLKAGPGGGGGAYAKKVLTVEPGGSLTIVVGQGGSGLTSANANGGNSYVSYNSTTVVNAAGGSGASGNDPGLGGNASYCIGDVTFSGGAGGQSYNSGVFTHRSGGGGGAAGAGGNGGNGTNGVDGGAGGTVATGSIHSGKGGDGKYYNLVFQDGNDGNNYGGGGSGGVSGTIIPANGGNGAPGYVLLTYKDCASIVIDPGTIVKETWVCSLIPDTTIMLTSLTEAGPIPGSYFWELSTDNGSNWSTIAGANINSYVATATGWYRRGFSTLGCNNKGYTDIMEVTHPGEIDPGIISDNRSDADTTVCIGNNLSVTLTSTSTYPKIWQMSVDNGLTWVDVPSNDVTPLTLTNVTQDVWVRHTIHYSLTCELISNNYYIIKAVTKPVINSLSAIDTCPGLTEYIITPNITQGDGAITTYFWNGDVDGNSLSADTIPAYISEICDHTYSYSLRVKDENGCFSSVVIGSFTTPDESGWSASFTEVNAEVNPTICSFVVPDLKDTLESCFHSSCHFITSYTQNPVAGTTMATGTKVKVDVEFHTVCGNTRNISIWVNAPSAIPELDPSDITFDDSNDTIYLYYGTYDTLYNVTPPTYTSTSPYKDDFVLSNNISSANAGPILGRLSVNTDTTIIWTISDPCLHHVNYTKHYIVLYPKCGNGMTVTDVDGNEYETVRIGSECWTKTNLRTSTVSDTSFIYQNNPANDTLFGRLYTWYSAVGLTKDATTAPATTTDPVSNITYIQGVCPTGWAVPTLNAYNDLNAIAGGTQNLKSSNPKTWLNGMTGTDAIGFGAVAGGYYTEDGYNYINLLGEAYYWTCEGDPVAKKGTCCSITHTCPIILTNSTYTGMGFSVRCVKRAND